MARDLGDAAGQTYPRIERSVSGPRFGRLGPSGSGWLVPRGSKSGLSAPKFHRFYGPEMADFGRFPGFRISDAPPTYSPVLMYLEIQLLAGFPELEIASFANTFRCFDVPGNPGFERLPGARNRDFREEIPPVRGAGESNFWQLP